jgi:hypothetical protein
MFCKQCGTKNEGDAKFCPKCGTPFSGDVKHNTPDSQAHPSTSVGEKIFFERDVKATNLDSYFGSTMASKRDIYVKVTSSRIIIRNKKQGDQTYALSGITSVKEGEVKRPMVGFLSFVIVIMIFSMFAQGGWAYLYMPLFACIPGWLISKLAEHAVVISSASGETKAFTRRDKKLVEDIIKAINDAIVHRG